MSQNLSNILKVPYRFGIEILLRCVKKLVHQCHVMFNRSASSVTLICWYPRVFSGCLLHLKKFWWLFTLVFPFFRLFWHCTFIHFFFGVGVCSWRSFHKWGSESFRLCSWSRYTFNYVFFFPNAASISVVHSLERPSFVESLCCRSYF
jgi:hypothetical protein